MKDFSLEFDVTTATTFNVKMRPVESSNISAVGYDADRRVLVVQFRGAVVGSPYDPAWIYLGVSQETHQELLAAPSIGSYFARRVRDNPAYARAKAEQVRVVGDEAAGSEVVEP